MNKILKNKSIQELESIVRAARAVSDILKGNPLEEHLQIWNFSSYREMFAGMKSQELLDLANETHERLSYLKKIAPSYAAAMYFGIEATKNGYSHETIYSGQVQFTLENGLTWKAEGKYDEDYRQSWIEFTLVDTKQPDSRKPSMPIES